jgi:hypothetical protein
MEEVRRQSITFARMFRLTVYLMLRRCMRHGPCNFGSHGIENVQYKHRCMCPALLPLPVLMSFYKNSYGVGKQATALAARGTQQGFYGMKITGNQDTLLADAAGGYQYYRFRLTSPLLLILLTSQLATRISRVMWIISMASQWYRVTVGF